MDTLREYKRPRQEAVAYPNVIQLVQPGGVFYVIGGIYA